MPAGSEPVPMAETWGRGSVFGVMPLSDGRVYCYAAAPAPAGARSPDDELAELVRRFGGWHPPGTARTAPTPRTAAPVPGEWPLHSAVTGSMSHSSAVARHAVRPESDK
jgi:hypothetical protein